jgi:DNA-directed RNA polymerase specialized sigma24 family protein
MPDNPPTGLHAVFVEMRPALIRRAAAMGAGVDAEDVVQDVWLKLGSLTGPIASPEAYLYRMIYTAVLDRRRGVRRAAARDASWAAPANEIDDRPIDPEAERRLIAVQTLRAAECVPVEQRRI